MERARRVAGLVVASACICCAKSLPLPEPYAGAEPRSDPSGWVDAIPDVARMTEALGGLFGAYRRGAVEGATQLGLETAARFKLGMGTGDVMDVVRRDHLVMGKAAEPSRCRGNLTKPLCLEIRLPGRQMPPFSISRLFYDEWPGTIPYDLSLALVDDRVVSMSLQVRPMYRDTGHTLSAYFAQYYGTPPDEAIRLGEKVDVYYEGGIPAWNVRADGLFHWWWGQDRYAVLLEVTSHDEGGVVAWGFPEIIGRPKPPDAAPVDGVRPLPEAPPSPAGSRPGLLEFYAPARDRAASPPDEGALKIQCQVPLRGSGVPPPYAGLWISLLGIDDGPVRLAAFTKASFVDPAKAIWLRPRLAPFPIAVPRQGTADWGWAYDRNGDGRIDYLVDLRDVLPVLPDPVPAAFPGTGGAVSLDGTPWRLAPRPQAAAVAQSKPLFEAALKYAQGVFRHRADDDFDGKVDALVLEELEPAGLFVKGWLAYRSSRAAGDVDEAWAFRGAIDDRTRTLDPDLAGYLVPGVGKLPAERVGGHLAIGTDRIRAINAALRECGLGPASLARSP